jgi:MFS family permease
VTAGLSTGVCALLVPDLLHAAGASPGQIGLDFAVAGIMFAVGSALTAAAGRRAVTLPVACGGMLVLAAALTPAVLGAAPLPLVVMLCVSTAARAVLWTVSYPLAAAASQKTPGSDNTGNTGNTGLGASIGLLNVIWAATAVLGPLAAGLAAEHLGAGAAFGLTQAACVAALAVTVAMTWRGRPRREPPAGPGWSPIPGSGRKRSASARPN